MYSLFSGALFSGTLQRFGISDADVNFITGWLISIIETLGLILANGENYTPNNFSKTAAPLDTSL